jgi:hypothetical protein
VSRREETVGASGRALLGRPVMQIHAVDDETHVGDSFHRRVIAGPA